MKKLLVGLLTLTSLCAFSQENPFDLDCPTHLSKEECDGIKAKKTDWEALAEEAARQTDEELADQILELTNPKHIGLSDEISVSKEELSCLSLTSLQVHLQTKEAKRLYKRSARKSILKQITDEKFILNCK